VRQDALDGDLLLESLEPGALGSKHFRHPARSQFLDDPVALLLMVVLGFGHVG
jgi:hypothetical protein